MNADLLFQRGPLFTTIAEQQRSVIESTAREGRICVYDLDLMDTHELQDLYSGILDSFNIPHRRGGMNLDATIDLISVALAQRPDHWVLLAVCNFDALIATRLQLALHLVHFLTLLADATLRIEWAAPSHRVGLRVVYYGTGCNYPEMVGFV